MPKRTRDESEVLSKISERPSSTLRICVGSYEHVLYGIDAVVQTNKAGELEAQFNPVYMFEAHTAQIKSCAIGGRYLASGGVDEVLKLYDLKGRRDLGSLLSHDGTISTIQFSRPNTDGSVTHMLSGDENNRIIIWRCKDWTPLIQLTTRHGTVNDLSIHPSGKICISVGRDLNVRLWNLVTGKKAAAFKLGREEPLRIKWNEIGDAYAILFDKSINVYDMSATLQHSFSAERTRFHDLSWFTRSDGRELILASRDDGKLVLLDPVEKHTVQTLEGHKTRVKALSIERVVPQGREQEVTIFCSGSTDGEIILWADSKANDFQEIGRYNCGECRITCLATCDAEIENMEGIMRRRIKLENQDDEEGDVSVKEEDVEKTLKDGESDEDDEAAQAGGLSAGSDEEEEFTGFQ